MKKLTIFLSIIFIYCFAQGLSAQELSANAKAELGKNNYLPAIDELTVILSNNPNSEPALTYRANFYNRSGQFEKALIDATKAISLNSKNVSAMMVSGSAKVAQQKYKDAIIDFTNVLALQSTLKSALMLRAQVYVKVSDYQKAKADLDLAIKSDPKNMEAYMYRARIYATENDFAGAMSDYTFIRENAEPYSKAKEVATSELLKTQELFAKKMEADKLATMKKMSESVKPKSDDYFDNLSRQMSNTSKDMGEVTKRLNTIMLPQKELMDNWSNRINALDKNDFKGRTQLYKELNTKMPPIIANIRKEIANAEGKEYLLSMKVQLEELIPVLEGILYKTRPYAARYYQYNTEVAAISPKVYDDIKKTFTAYEKRDKANFNSHKIEATNSLGQIIELMNTGKKDLAKFNDATFNNFQTEVNSHYEIYNKKLSEIKALNL